MLHLGKYILLLDLSLLQWTVVVLCAGIAGIAKVAFGIGAGVFLTPVLALAIDPRLTVGLMMPMMLITDVSALQHHWRKWHAGHLKILLPTVFAGIVVGTLFLAWAPTSLLRKVIGAIALLYVVVQLQQLSRPGKVAAFMPAWAGSTIGFVAGITTAVAHSGGIVLSIYLLNVGLAKNTFISTLVTVFFLGDLLKTALYWQTGILTLPMVLTGLLLAPVMLLGGNAGMWMNRRVTVEQFTRLVLVIVGLSGAVLLATS